MSNLLVSFSGGRSSAYLMKMLWERFRDRHTIVNVFANTGQEAPETLAFVERCSSEWGIPVVWVESDVNMEMGQGTKAKVVDYLTASRHGEPFESVIAKYGIPNVSFPHCTRELKQRPINAYIRSIGWDKWDTALGIRADEPKRFGPRKGIVFPLVHWFPTYKREINIWWESQPFQLNLQEHQGNCSWCWKKSLSKLIRIAGEDPRIFDFPARMESTYGDVGPTEQVGNVFFRDKRSAKDIIAISQIAKAPPLQGDIWSDQDVGCSESCEAF